MSSKLAVDFAGVAFKNPVVMASGTFGFGREYNQLFPIETGRYFLQRIDLTCPQRQ